MSTQKKTEEKQGFDLSALQNQILSHVREQGGSAAVGGETFVKSIIQKTYQAMLEAEMEEHLGYPKDSREAKDTDNRRNGYIDKRIRTDVGEISIQTPRDRDGSFSPKAVEKRQKNVKGFSDKIISLYAKGMTTRDIEAHLKDMYEIDVSAAFISKITDAVSEEIVQWQNRPLDRLYPVVYMDGVRFNVKNEDNVVKKKVVYLCLGITPHGQQSVLGMWIAENEGAAFWMNVCTELKARGVEDILIACIDGLKGLPEAIGSVFPQVDIQHCVVHQIRTSTKFITFKDRKAFCRDLKEVYGAPTLQAAEAALDKLDQLWGQKYPASIQTWRNNWKTLSTFFKYPMELRKIIYTTNSIENLNGQLRKNTRNRKVFPHDDALVKLLYLNIRDITKDWTFKQNWNIVMNQLAILFHDRLLLDPVA